MAERRHGPTLLAAIAAAAFTGGCASAGYYAQSVGGHLRLMAMRQPVDRIINDAQTPEALRQRLRAASAMRDFARDRLDLPDNGSYRSYVALDRRYVSWTVVAAPEFSLEPEQWCFPVAGCVAYRGYFDQRHARRFADTLSKRGFDVVVSGVQAYSTLGWFDDPLLESMVRQPEFRLAGMIFHELAHQRVYASGDSSFNEAYAVVVEREGVRRWLDHAGDAALKQQHRSARERHEAFLELVHRGRRRLESLYASGRGEAEMRAARAEIFDAMREEYVELRRSWKSYAGYDAWFGPDLNNARLALAATYNAHVPALEVLLERHAGSLPAFNAACESLARLSADERSAVLARLAPG